MDDTLASALALVQTQLPKVGKSSTAKLGQYSYSYADLASIHNVVLPLLGAHGLAWMTMPTFDDQGNFVLRYELLHESGESRVGFYPLPSASSKAQDLGSAITYGRRYTLSSVVGIAPDDDDDGATAPAAPPRRMNVSRTPPTATKVEAKIDADSVKIALDAAKSMEELRSLWGDAKEAGLQEHWKALGTKFREAKGVNATELWTKIMLAVPKDWPTSKVEEDFKAVTGVSADRAGVPEMESYLDKLADE